MHSFATGFQPLFMLTGILIIAIGTAGVITELEFCLSKRPGESRNDWSDRQLEPDTFWVMRPDEDPMLVTDPTEVRQSLAPSSQHRLPAYVRMSQSVRK